MLPSFRYGLGRVSVPMWPITLSSRLLIVALVGRYLTNQLIRRGSILYHRSFSHCFMRSCALMRYQQSFPTVVPQYKAGYPRVTHPSATKFTIARLHVNSVRLACVRHAASVHPEPGSNSHVKMVFVSCQFYLALFTVNSGSFSIFFIDLLVLESRNSFF